MHLHPLLFLGGFMFIVPGIFIAIGTTIVLTRPAAQPQPHAMEVSPWLLAWLTGGRDPGDSAGDVQLTQ